jgi:hypothetical protein
MDSSSSSLLRLHLPLRTSPSNLKSPIPVLIHDFNVFQTLRANHRLLGIQSGTLPVLSQQNVFLGLPWLLMEEEWRSLVDEGRKSILNRELEN